MGQEILNYVDHLAQYFSMAVCIQNNATTKTAMIPSVFLIVQIAELYCPWHLQRTRFQQCFIRMIH